MTTESASASAAAMASSTLPAGARGAGVEHPGGVLVGAQVRVDERGALGERRLHVEHGGEVVVVDLDGFSRVPRLRRAARHDDRHALAREVTVLVAGERDAAGVFMSGVIGQAQGNPTPSRRRGRRPV